MAATGCVVCGRRVRVPVPGEVSFMEAVAGQVFYCAECWAADWWGDG